MARLNPLEALKPSIIDRLIDPESREGYDLRLMEAAVRRDVDDLLNTRQTHVGLPEAFVELHNSIAAYGLPDLTSLNALTGAQREQIGRSLEDIIARFEPRLRDVRATLVSPGDDIDRRIRFRVEARLCVDPAPDVPFDAVLDLATGHYTVNPSET
jgi:type VI secretion system protein ImpF